MIFKHDSNDFSKIKNWKTIYYNKIIKKNYIIHSYGMHNDFYAQY